jgi:hypothetical protein
MAKSKQSQDAQELNDLLKDVLKTQKQINEERIKDLDITRSINDEVTDGLKALNKESDFKSAIRRSLKEINKLSEQNFDLSELDLKLSSNKEDISKRQNALNKSQLSLLREQTYVNKKINTLLSEKAGATIDEQKAIDKQIESFERVQKGLTEAVISSDQYSKNLKGAAAGVDKLNKLIVPNAFKGLSEIVKDIPGLRKLSGPFEAMSLASKDTASRMTKINIQRQAAGKEPMFSQAQIGLKSLTSGFSALGPVIKKALGPFALVSMAVEAIKFFIDAMFAASIQIANFQRNLAVSKDTAVEIRDRFFEISDSAKALANTQTGNLILQKDLVEAQESFNNALGLAVDLSTKQNEEFAAQFTNVKKFYNLNEQEQKGLINLNVINGKTVNETKNSILGQTALYKINTKEAINVKKVLKDVLTTSNSIKLSIRGGGEALTQAVINTQRLGISLADVDKISDSLLNFEQSISSELEAELLTGRDLNLEKARAAALSNDQVTLTEEINRLVKDAGPDFEKNKIAMQASAAAIGIGVDQLADMVTQQKAVEKFKQNFNALDNQAIKNSKKLTDKEKQRLLDGTASTAEYYKFAKEQGKDLNLILGDEMATRLEAQDAQQKFNDSLEKAKETFSRFVDGGALDTFADFLVKFVESVGIKGLGRTLIGGLADDSDIAASKVARKQEQMAAETDTEKKKQIQSEIDKIQQDFQKSNYNKQDLATVMEKKEAPLSNKAEGISSIDAKDFVIKTLPEDTVVAAGGTSLGNSKEMVQLLTEQNQLLAGILNKEGTIVLNGTKMGTAMAVGSYRTQ